MKTWITMLLISIAVITLCIWDGVHTSKTFRYLEQESEAIYIKLQTTPVTDEQLSAEIINLNNFWTKKMDILCISISRKDLQVVSDYLQYLCASIINNSQEDAVTYSRLLNYNIIGLAETNGISVINLL